MRYWIARLLGRADGDAVRCPSCRSFFSREDGVMPAFGSATPCCSQECADEATRAAAW